MAVTILLLAAAPATDAPGARHHGGKSADRAMFYVWAGSQAVVVSQRMPDPGAVGRPV
jgi:hypothetical protein